MAPLSLEQRLAELEKQVAELQQTKSKQQMQEHHTNGTAKPWLETLGCFAGDEVMKEIFAEALKYREKDRAKARRRGRKTVPQRAKK